MTRTALEQATELALGLLPLPEVLRSILKPVVAYVVDLAEQLEGGATAEELRRAPLPALDQVGAELLAAQGAKGAP